MIYKELTLNVPKHFLIYIFNKNKDKKLKKYCYKDVTGKILGQRDYYEMYFTYDEGKRFFYDIFPFKCRGYQYVYLPPYYNMVIHKDIEYIPYRIGCILKGTAEILFFDDAEKNIIAKYNYDKPILTNVQIKHTVRNDSNYRLTFFVNFTKAHINEYQKLL